jgi:hypothetical protein
MKWLLKATVPHLKWHFWRKFSIFCKPGGLDSPDQSRLRSRLSFMLRSNFIKCQDYPSCQHQNFSQLWFLKLRFFSRDFVVSRFLSRLSRRIEIVKLCQDTLRFVKICQDASRFVEKSWHYQDFLSFTKTNL